MFDSKVLLLFYCSHPLTFPFVPQQVIARQELELWLSQRVKLHAEHREDLRIVLKTYVNGSKPMDDAAEDTVLTST
jgi:hypothetical protein